MLDPLGKAHGATLLSSRTVPELPEVETVRRSLSRALCGRRVVGVEARDVRLRDGIDPAHWPPLIGLELEAVDRRGKYLVARFGPLAAVLHLGMSGRLLVVPSAAPPAPHTHLTVRFAGEVELRFVDPRRFGSATVYPIDALPRVSCLAGLGPDALCEDAGRAVAVAAARSRAPIRNMLLDQRILAGLGNIYATEALARAGIRPTRPGRSLGATRLARLGGAIAEVLGDALAAGGTTLDDGGFQDAEGNAGYFAVELLVYGREGRPCKACGTTIRRVVVAGRSAFYCPRCQR